MKLYIDPGTGSMLFTILIGIFGTMYYVIRLNFVKLKMRLSRGKEESFQMEKIPFAIYSDHKRYWNVFEPICKALNERGVDVVYLTSSEDDPVFCCGLEHVKGQYLGKGNRAFAKLNYISANIILSTTPGLEVYQWKRSKDVDCYVHILHASSDVTLYRMFGIDYYDALLVSGQYQIDDIRKLEKMRNLPAKEIIMTGLPYMDEMVSRLEKANPIPKEESKITVLVAPSWGSSSIFGKFGGEVLKELLKTDYHIIVRPHPQSFISETEMIEKIMKEYPESERLEWNRDNDNFEVLRRSDIMISDFSGVIFDFALVYDKPVIYTDTKFDHGPYDAWWLNQPTWTENILPKIGEKLTESNMPQIGEIVERCMKNPAYARGREQARKETWEFKGEGTEHVVDFLLSKYDEIKKAEADK